MKLEEGILGQETRRGGYGRTRRQESGGEEFRIQDTGNWRRRER
jgi:hypothetical protein